jgi:hypothetical protein
VLLAHTHPVVSDGHLGHLVVGGAALLLASVVAVVTVLRDRRRGSTSRITSAGSSIPGAGTGLAAVGWSAVAMAGAATVHGAVVREHFGEAALLGTFFLLLTLAQYGYALAVLLRPRAWLIRVGLLANVAVVVLWVYTRTVGIPFGIAGGEVEHVELADLMAAGFEIAAVTAGVLALQRGLRSRPVRASLSTAQQVAAVCVVALSGAVLASFAGS